MVVVSPNAGTAASSYMVDWYKCSIPCNKFVELYFVTSVLDYLLLIIMYIGPIGEMIFVCSVSLTI